MVVRTRGWLAGAVVMLTLFSVGAYGSGVASANNLSAGGSVPASSCPTGTGSLVDGLAIDGNEQRQCANGQNWADGPGGAGIVQATRNSNGTCTNASTSAIVICDGVKKADQSVFSGGNKEANPCNWNIKSAPPPPDIKDDIANAYLSSSTQGNETYVAAALDYVGITNNPSRDFDIEFNQRLDAAGNPYREPGDILVSVDYGGNNAPETVKVFVAKTPAQDSHVQTCASEPAGYDFSAPDFQASGSSVPVIGPNITAAVNQHTIGCGSWGCYDKKYNLVDTLPAGDYFSVGLDVTSILKSAGLTGCKLGYVDFRSRASGESAQSQLKDDVGPVAFHICPTTCHGV